MSSSAATLFELAFWFVLFVALLAIASKLTGTSESGDSAARRMTSGGGAGRKYLPKPKATMTMTPTITRGFVRRRPIRNAQSSHRAPESQPRQPFRGSRAPQFAQKFERLIVGVFGKSSRIIFGLVQNREP
jgi:hypothetical protein